MAKRTALKTIEQVEQLAETKADEGKKFSDFDLITDIENSEVVGIQGGKNVRFDSQFLKGQNGKNAYQIYVDEGGSLSQSEWLESLKGKKGDRGEIGADGLKGDKGDKGDKGVKGDKGDKGDAFRVDGVVNTIVELPDATTFKGQIWLTNEFGHLHYAKGDDATDWVDWGQFTGVKGDKGDRGPQGLKGDKGDNGKDGKDSDHVLPTGGNPTDVLSMGANGDLQWSPRRVGYQVTDFKLNTINDEFIIADAFNGLCDVIFRRTTSEMSSIRVKFKLMEDVNLFYSSQRLGGNENRNLDKLIVANEYWTVDPDLICNNYREISVLSCIRNGVVYDMNTRAGFKGTFKVWFNEIK